MIEKLTIDEMAESLRLDFCSDSEDNEITDIDVYFAAMESGYTHCTCCDYFVPYDNYCGNESMCNECLGAQ